METTMADLVLHDDWARDVLIVVAGWLALLFVVTILLLVFSGIGLQ